MTHPETGPMERPPLGLVAPFFLAAPLGLVAAGLLLATAGREVLYATNVPTLVATTHALLIGWITTTIMGATFQIGGVVLGGRLLSERLARAQFVLHVGIIALFVWAVWRWDTTLMALAGVGLVASFLAYLANAGWLLATAPRWSLPRAYMSAALVLLVATFSLGFAFAGTHAYGWFPMSLGLLSAHAHLGMVGWLGLTLMGVSFQLVPMFNLINRARPRLGWVALVLTIAGVAAFASIISTNPGPGVRLAAALTLALGPAVWGGEQVWLLAHRSRRRTDIHGKATAASLAFLLLAIVLGLGAARGTPFTPDSEGARWLLAYGGAGVLGWAGCALLGNSYKIVPFLVWLHRYSDRAGREPVPVLADISSDRAATAVLALHVAATLTLVSGALLGSLPLLQAGGMVLIGVGAAHAATLGFMFLPKQPSASPLPERRPAPS